MHRTVEFLSTVKCHRRWSREVYVYLGKKNIFNNETSTTKTFIYIFCVWTELSRSMNSAYSPISLTFCWFSGYWKIPVSYLKENVVVHDARTEEDVILVSGMCLLVVVSNLKHSHDFFFFILLSDAKQLKKWRAKISSRKLKKI